MSEVYDYFQQGRRHLRKGMAAQATVPLEKAKRREPNKASIRESLGIAYFRIGRYDEAAAEFRAMLELSPADDYAHYALGRCLEKQGHVAEANGHYKLARSLRPGSKQYATTFIDPKTHAITVFDSAVRAEPTQLPAVRTGQYEGRLCASRTVGTPEYTAGRMPPVLPTPFTVAGGGRGLARDRIPSPLDAHGTPQPCRA